VEVVEMAGLGRNFDPGEQKIVENKGEKRLEN
jgi:hypothetical protein